jgi:metal-sulfur cluster biosynthetic enzyme
MSIVDLGLIYGVAVAGDAVTITMTLTSIGCPAIDMIADDIRAAVHALPGVRAVHVQVVWSPPWTKDMISERGRKVLALHGVVS